MSRSIRIPTTDEQKVAKKIGKLLTEDFSNNLEIMGRSLVSDLPTIIFRRLEVVYLAAKEEYDTIMGEDPVHDIFR